eukprot:3630552-Pyramimonas_sp.AAC.1
MGERSKAEKSAAVPRAASEYQQGTAISSTDSGGSIGQQSPGTSRRLRSSCWTTCPSASSVRRGRRG